MQRLQELRLQIATEVSTGLIAREICDRNARMAELQARWNWLRDQFDCIVQERGAALATEAPGGGTGLLIKEWIKGKEEHVVYRIDRGLLELIRLLLDHEKSAVEESGGGKVNLQAIEEQPDLSCLTDEELSRCLELFKKMEVPATT